MASPTPSLSHVADAQNEDDLTLRLKSFTLTDDEQGEIFLSHADVVESEEECRKSLFGKVISQKSPNLFGLKNTMEKVWGNPKDFRVLAIGDGIFQFIFPSELDATRVLRGKPWFFNNHFLILERWKPNIPPKNYCYDIIPIWVQAWGIPLQFLSKDVGVKLGLKFGDVDDVVIPPAGSREGRFIRIRTYFNVMQPLKRGCMIRFASNSPVWVEFRYEKLPSFCRYCGCVGHEMLNCDKRFLDLENEVVQPLQYGEWLRVSPATQPGRRHDGTERGGRPSPAKSSSAATESSAENQRSKSRGVNSNLNGDGNLTLSVPNCNSPDSAHDEMLTEVYLAERSTEFAPASVANSNGNKLDPFMQEVLRRMARPISSYTAIPNPAQTKSPQKSPPTPISTKSPSGPLSKPSLPSNQSLAKIPIPVNGPSLTSPSSTITPPLPNTSNLNYTSSYIPSLAPPSASLTLIPSSKPVNPATVNASPLVEVPILADTESTLKPSKRSSTPRGRQRSTGNPKASRNLNPQPSSLLKPPINCLGKRRLVETDLIPNILEIG
ncbi:hypothetical protein C3L33_02375, partial [Rhododendron williamsianum]